MMNWWYMIKKKQHIFTHVPLNFVPRREFWEIFKQISFNFVAANVQCAARGIHLQSDAQEIL